MLHIARDVAMQLPGVPCFRPTIAALLSVAAIVGARGDATSFPSARGPAISSLGPSEVVAGDFEELSAIAVDAHGAVLVTDRRAGTLTRIGAGGRQTALDNLQRPGGIAVDSAGSIFVIEAGRRVVRLDPGGVLSLVTSSIRQARAIAAGPDGRIWVAIRREQGPGFEILGLEASGVLTNFSAGFIDVRGLAVDGAAVYVTMASMATDSRRERTTLARIPLRPNGASGPVEPMLRNMPGELYGVAIDAAGDVFVSGASGPGGKEGSGVILKQRSDGEVHTVAAGLHDPVAMAFGLNGDLFTVEKNAPARVLRFRAPPRPTVDAPLFTNNRPLRIGGRAQPGDLVRVFDISDGTRPLAASVADPATGAFVLETPLAANAGTALSFVATAAAGAGLVGPAATTRIVHDDHLPRVAIAQPFPGAHIRGVVLLAARAEDEGSGVASMKFIQDQSLVATVHNPEPGQPLIGTAGLDAALLADGPHALTVVATDRAGNSAATAQLLVVDRTPPDTRILTGPPDETAARTATLTFEGSDAQSANLDFAWRLDDGAWSAFTASPAVEFAALAPGTHRFEVKARDLAGNEDPTPAAHAFTVTPLRIRILEPAPGEVMATGTIWVRGTVESGGRDVAVTIPLPPEFRDDLSLEELPAATEAGTFAAEVPVTPSLTTVTVIARDGQRASSTDSVNVVVQGALSESIRFEAFPAAGFAPHTARFSPGAFPPGSFYSLDQESDGTIEHEGGTLQDLEFVYARPGIHVAVLHVTTPGGRRLTARTSVGVYNRMTLEARLQAAWRGFKDALRGGDVARAASFVHSGRRAAWEEYFRQFTPDLFAATDMVFANVTLLDIAPGRAECEMMRDVDGLLYSFPVSFVVDVDGGWRLWQF